MLRITVNKSASGAKKYYCEEYYKEGHLHQDYYSENGQAIGRWNGKAASLLKLNGDIHKDDFSSLCDNLKPRTDESLTTRNNSERRVGYDFTFNASKSVSLAYTFANAKDKKLILQAFQDSVKEAMLEIEAGAQTRIRQRGQNDNRDTGNIAYGEFTHFTSRPVGGVPDPHLHAHCFVFNATYDQTEEKWKAIELGQVKKDAPYYEVVFHSTLAIKLKDLGYSIEKGKTGFEIAGINRETIEKFSNRTNEIERLAKDTNITDKEEKARLGAKTRENKRETISESEQTKNWHNRLTVEEKQALKNLKNSNAGSGKEQSSAIIAKDALTHSIEHHLERKSVTTDKEVLTTAIQTSLGKTTIKEIKESFAKDTSIIKVKEKGETFVTTKAVLQEENNLIAKAQASKGTFKPINETYQTKTAYLNNEQKNAVRYTLTTSDGISMIVGKAGTGKTTLVKEVRLGIEESGKNIFAFAPSADVSRVVQRKEGFENAETLAALFQSKTMQEKLKNGVVWVDEAGTMSNKQMGRLLDIAKEQNCRIMLTGDPNQHSSVERGDAMRTLIKHAGINSILVSKIQRQENKDYKEAVSFLSKLESEKGFNKLNKMGAIREITDSEERVRAIAADFITSTYGDGKKQKAKEVLVISPTHAEGNKVTEQIREVLKQRQLISRDEKPFNTFKNIQLTNAEKQKPENYKEGNHIVFQQNTKGFKAGSNLEIVSKNNKEVLVKNSLGKVQQLPLNKTECFQVYEPRRTDLSVNDKIRITNNGKSTRGKNLFNGSVFTVTGFDKDNNIKLSNGSTISKEYGHFTLGYVMTSHASQGKTVDKVIISQSSMSFRAASKEQFYVSVSRGKQAVSIYTDDKGDLLRSISQSGERKSAIELTQKKATQ